MPNKNYIRGRASEYKCQRDLETLGYQTARTAGSHGAADVIAWNKTHIRFIQCKTFKTNQGSYSADLKKIESLLLPPSSQAELWTRKIGQKGWHSQDVLRVAPPLNQWKSYMEQKTRQD
jgi:hypothetical protein